MPEKDDEHPTKPRWLDYTIDATTNPIGPNEIFGMLVLYQIEQLEKMRKVIGAPPLGLEELKKLQKFAVDIGLAGGE